MKYILLVLFLLINQAQAEEDLPFIHMEGIGSLSTWTQDPVGKPGEDNLKARLRADGWINVTKNGCVKIQGRLTTGNKFNNEWVNTGVGTNEADFSLSLRHLYVSATCLKNLKVEFGSVPVSNSGGLGLSDNGYVDGLNITIKDEENDREWVVSVGSVEAEANLLKRDYDKVNHASVQLNQGIGKNGTGILRVSKYEESYFTRAGIRWAVSEYLKWLEETGAEVLFSDDRLIGGMIHSSFTLDNWKSRVVVSRINPDPHESDRLAFLLKQFYGYGDNILIESNKALNDKVTLNLRFRLGDAGPMAQAGLTYKLPRLNWR